MSEKLYRFMLAFDGEPQGVGILQGLEDSGIDFSVSEDLYKAFGNLPCPTLESPDDSPIECWFREKGIAEFGNAIDEIIYELSLVNWQVLGQVIEESVEGSLYADDYQAAFAYSYLETDKSKYIEIGSVQEILNQKPAELTLMNSILNSIDETKFSESARVSVVWDSYGIAVDLNFSYDEQNGYGTSQLCFAETYDDGAPDQACWQEALQYGQALSKKFNLPLDVSRDDVFLNSLACKKPSLDDKIRAAAKRTTSSQIIPAAQMPER